MEITLFKSKDVNKYCLHSMNANVTITCNMNTIMPSLPPTTVPTESVYTSTSNTISAYINSTMSLMIETVIAPKEVSHTHKEGIIEWIQDQLLVCGYIVIGMLIMIIICFVVLIHKTLRERKLNKEIIKDKEYEMEVQRAEIEGDGETKIEIMSGVKSI